MQQQLDSAPRRTSSRARDLRSLTTTVLFAAAFNLLSPPASAAEGQWMPQQISELNRGTLDAMGLELSADQLWDGKGGGILRGVVNVRGCSGAFVSDRGLVATNHHCAYGALQAASRETNKDYLHTGLVAQTLAEEVRAPGLWIQVLESIDDVTAPIREDANKATSNVERAKAVDRKTNELLLKCERDHPQRRCRIAAFEMGTRFLQFVTLELRDIRMVFAPPSSLGNFGGEVDNWMWPRHAADVTFIRGYVAPDGSPAEFAAKNVPYKAPVVLPMTATGVDEGSFVMTVGYPGKTQRYLSSGEVKRQLKQVFPGVISTYGTWIELQKGLSTTSPAIKLKVTARMRSLMNRHKNARGMVDGIVRMKLSDRRDAEDAKIRTPLVDEMNAISDVYRKAFPRDVVLSNFRRVLPGLSTAIDLHRRAREGAKPEIDRRPRYMERTAPELWSRLERNMRDFDAHVEEVLLDDVLRRFRALDGAATKIDLGEFGGPSVVLFDAKKIVDKTRMGERSVVERLFNSKTLAADLDKEMETDALLRLGKYLAVAIEKMEEEHLDLEGRHLAIGPSYFEALKRVKGGAVYPDANGTLRFSYAQVRGYAPQDGSFSLPQTTLAGAIEKHSGQSPFVLPQKVIDLASSASATAWADGELGALPVNFLSTSDTTGGNSGSPVLDGKGRLVGFNFDRVWENIAGDFGYHPSRSRNVIVDARYVLWLLDKVYDAGSLLKELGLHDLRGRTEPVDTASAPTTTTAVYRQLFADSGRTKKIEEKAPQSTSKSAPQSTSAIILAAILLVAGFALLIGRRRKD